MSTCFLDSELSTCYNRGVLVGIWIAGSFQCSISIWSTAISNKSTVAWLYCMHTLYVIVIYIYTVGVGYLCYYTESEAKPRISVNNKDILQLATVI